MFHPVVITYKYSLWQSIMNMSNTFPFAIKNSDSARDYAFQSDRAILDDHIAMGLRYLRCPLIEKVR